MKITTLFFTLICTFHFLQAKTIRVPDDAQTIQDAISLAAEHDTILVQPGVYKESINFNGKNIVVGSRYLVSGDTSFISATIIDGDTSKTCAVFKNEEDTTAVLCGFTLTNGNGGIRCYSASPKLKRLLIIDNHYRCPVHQNALGGGIFLINSHAVIENVTITRNKTIWNCAGADRKRGAGIYVEQSQLKLNDVKIFDNFLGVCNWGGGEERGGGIYCSLSSLNLKNVTIYGHSAFRGGGIYCTHSSIYLEHVTINNNSAQTYGGGIYSDNSKLVFSKTMRSNIFLNQAITGFDLYTTEKETTTIFADTFTVLKPNAYHAYSVGKLIFDILNGKVKQVHADLYVNPSGNDNNSGLRFEAPLRTIRQALIKITADSMNPHTVHLAEGRYGPSENGEVYPLYIPDYVSLSGTKQDRVILDAEGKSHIGVYLTHNPLSSIENLTIYGLIGPMSPLGILYQVSCYGIYCNNSSPRLENLTISHCLVHPSLGLEFGWGYGVYCENNSHPTIINMTISENYGGIRCHNNSNPILMNVTISENYDGIYCCGNSNPSLINTIIWSDTLQKVTFAEAGETNSITIAYSDIQCGLDSILTNGNGTIYWLEGNIDTDPKFVNPAQGNFGLQKYSPCIDTGIQNALIVYNNKSDTLLIPAIGFVGSAPDIGAYEFDPTTVDEKNAVNPASFALYQNYPNPFNPKTVISWRVGATPTSPVHVELNIYNILGQKLCTLVSEKQKAGRYQVEWDASDLASGVYLYQLTIDKSPSTGSGQVFTQTRKLVLLK